jgi:hypothetical protein
VNAEIESIIQIAAEAGSDTKRLVEPSLDALVDHRSLVLSGLSNIAAGKFGTDYHGIDRERAEQLRTYFTHPEIKASSPDSN